MDSVDPEVLKCFPEGATVTDVIPWGASGWSQTSRVSTEESDGSQKEYFLKSCALEGSAVMFAGEFASLSTMHALMPQSCPCPRGWGEYRTSPGTYFVVMDFLYLITELPAPERISGLIAGLHKTTAGTSPNNMFGFHVPTCHGKIAQPNDWDQDWSRFYAKLLRVFYDEDIKSNGEFPEYEKAFAAFEEHVIPRLLKPLQAEGRVLIPCLVHGDLWQENMGTNEETEDLMLYDPALFYGHNEFEIGMWRTNSVPFDETYRRHYLELIPPSEPANEWDDRNRLYSVFYHMSQSAHWVGAAKETRIRMLEDMSFLINKYALGQEDAPRAAS